MLGVPNEHRKDYQPCKYRSDVGRRMTKPTALRWRDREKGEKPERRERSNIFRQAREAEADGNLKVQLAFSLDGYQSITLAAEGHGTVQVNAVLKRKSKKRPPSQKDPGFKDDPYQ